jgi:methyl-accepting chemotaxis protein
MSRFNNLKISAKLGIAFGLTILFIVGLSLFTYFSLESAQNVSTEAVKGKELVNNISERWGDHLKYVKNLEESIIFQREFTGQLDPTLCKFGKWYSSFTPHNDKMKTAMEEINGPHHQLHEFAGEIKQMQQRGESKARQEAIYEKNIVPTVDILEKKFANFSQLVKEESDAEAETLHTKLADVQLMGIVLALVIILVSVLVTIVVSRAISKPVNELAQQAKEVADGNLTVNVVQRSEDEVGVLAGSFKIMVENLRNVIGNVLEASSAVASASSEISSSTEQMAAGSQEQSSQAGEVASAVEEMTRTIQENSKNAGDTAATAKHSKEAAETGGKVVEETVAGMKQIAEVVRTSAATVQELGKSSDQIGEIIEVIDDIADQTNLLALNAAIEAARAGEQGRGFAVVADEVRKLAERTTKATKEIAGMIKKIQDDTKGAVSSMNEGTKKVDEGIALADKAGISLNEIVQTSQKLTDMITQIAAASEQQSSASEQISKNVEGISAVTQETASGTQQVARAAEDLNRLTENLQELLSKFTISENAQSAHQELAGKSKSGVRKSHKAVTESGHLVEH